MSKLFDSVRAYVAFDSNKRFFSDTLELVTLVAGLDEHQYLQFEVLLLY